jgi:hypothetical protein
MIALLSQFGKHRYVCQKSRRVWNWNEDCLDDLNLVMDHIVITCILSV